MANPPRVGIPEREQGAAGAQRKAPGSAQGPGTAPQRSPRPPARAGPAAQHKAAPGTGALLRVPSDALRLLQAPRSLGSPPAEPPSRAGAAEPAGAEPRPAAARGTAGAVGDAPRAEPRPRPGRAGGGAPLRAPGSGPAGAGRAPGPSVRPGGVQRVGRAAVGGSRLPAGRSPSMSLVTVLKCIFGGRLAGPAGALRPPRRSSSAPFPARSAAAATEIREAILKAFALGDRGLFSSIGETPMQERQPRQPPTTSPPLPPLTPLLSSAPSREVRAGPPLLPHRGEGS